MPKQTTETVDQLPVGECHRSPSQPRHRDDEKKLDPDFVSSIREQGVLQPIRVRSRKAGGWEIVFGHRRHAGAVLAKLATIPAIVREMSDDEVFEAQLIENIHRRDMHPLDEADGFKRMIDRGRTAAQISEKIGRPISYVVQRLKLCELGKETRAALDKDEISLGIAVLIARVPAPLQAEALQTVRHAWNAAEAKHQLDATYLLRLDQAPFDIADAKLVEKAGACTACPKRTGQQRELFPDAARADMCIDRVCYRGKLDALWQIRLTEAKAGGAAVLEGQAAQRAVSYGSGWKKLDEEEWTGDKHVKVRKLFGKDLPPITLARDDRSGAIYELVKEADVNKVLKRRAPERLTASGQAKAQEARERQRAAAINLTVAAALERERKLSEGQLLRPLVHALVMRSWNDVQMQVSRRRGLEEGKKLGTGVEGRLLACLKKMKTPAEIAGLGLELALRSVAPGKWAPASTIWADTLKTLGLSYATFEKKVAAEARAKKKAKPAKKGAAK